MSFMFWAGDRNVLVDEMRHNRVFSDNVLWLFRKIHPEGAYRSSALFDDNVRAIY